MIMLLSMLMVTPLNNWECLGPKKMRLVFRGGKSYRRRSQRVTALLCPLIEGFYTDGTDHPYISLPVKYIFDPKPRQEKPST